MSMDIRLATVKMSLGGLLGCVAPYLQHIEEVSDGVQSWAVAEVIRLIGAGWRFYVQDSAGNKAYVIPVPPGYGHKAYIKTRSDGTISDNLLALPGGPLYRGGLFGLGIIRGAMGG